METQYRIRPLLKSDQEIVSSMFRRAAALLKDGSMLDIIRKSRAVSDPGESNEEDADKQSAEILEVFFDLFAKVAAVLTNEVNVFFANLIGVTPEEYQKLPLDIDVIVLEQLKDAPEVEHFFTGLSQTFSGAGLLKNMFAILKDRLGSIFD